MIKELSSSGYLRKRFPRVDDNSQKEIAITDTLRMAILKGQYKFLIR
ncbi:MAG: hypothetical protein CM15mP98_04370 [Paracoccaceae bacterium]|nr:MAG: hypothetical protein CM15mP98_04370 [Paracoccaceae bacterium]